jgi:hypothetical protein
MEEKRSLFGIRLAFLPMSYVSDLRSSIRPHAGMDVLAPQAERMAYEIRARLKSEETWRIIAQFSNDEDARAALWAIVFTSKYAEVQVRGENSATPLAEWPAGMTSLR